MVFDVEVSDQVARLRLLLAKERWVWFRGHLFDLAVVALPASLAGYLVGGLGHGVNGDGVRRGDGRTDKNGRG